jgi:hypothetical protein
MVGELRQAGVDAVLEKGEARLVPGLSRSRRRAFWRSTMGGSIVVRAAKIQAGRGPAAVLGEEPGWSGQVQHDGPDSNSATAPS